MKQVVSAILILCIIIGFSCFHSAHIKIMSDEIMEKSDKIFENIKDENWDEIRPTLDEVDSVWKEHRFWACITLPTNQIDEIDISIEQSKILAAIEAKDNFAGEFRMFNLLISLLPKQEGIALPDLL